MLALLELVLVYSQTQLSAFLFRVVSKSFWHVPNVLSYTYFIFPELYLMHPLHS